jgi:hypothetical protein
VSVGAGENRSNQASVHAPTSLPEIEEEDQVIVDDNSDNEDEALQTLEPAVTETAVTTTSSGRPTCAPVWMKD